MFAFAKKGPFALIALVALTLSMAFASQAVADTGDLPGFTDLEEEVLSLEEMRRYDATGVTRVLVDDEAVVRVMVSRDGKIIFLHALGSGTTEVEVFFGEDESRVFTVEVEGDLKYLMGDVRLSPGEVQTFGARGIQRVHVNDDTIAGVSVSDDNLELRIQGRAAGETMIHFYERGTDAPTSFRIIVSEE